METKLRRHELGWINNNENKMYQNKTKKLMKA